MASNPGYYVKQYRETTKSTVDKIFEDLENFQNFCVTYGYNYNPALLYKENNGIYKEFVKFSKGREPRNRWIEDAKKFNSENE